MPRSLLDLPLKLRPAVFFGYLAAQLALLIHAQQSPDFVFGFQMFNASSELRIALFRKVRKNGHARLVAVPGGAWQARDARGQVHGYAWQDRVHDGVLGTLDAYVHASYGLDAQLFRLHYALRDVASHIPDDTETEALVAIVDTVKNGRERAQIRIEGTRP